MKLRTAVTVAALVATPSMAAAAGSVTAGPVRVAGYTIALEATDAKKDSLTIMFDRGPLKNRHSHSLHFTTGVKVTVVGATAHIRGSLGTHGTINMRLQNARIAPPAKRKLPKGCVGRPGVVRTGRLVGQLKVRLPTGRMVTIKSMPVTTRINSKITKCTGPSTDRKGDGGEGEGDGFGGEPTLMLSSTQKGGVSFSFVATKKTISLVRSVNPKRTRGVTVSSTASVSAQGSNLLQPADGGSFAGVKSAGSFTGAGAYRSSTGPGPVTTGTLRGSLKIKMAGTPVITIAGDNAVLMNGDK